MAPSALQGTAGAASGTLKIHFGATRLTFDLSIGRASFSVPASLL